MDYREYQPHPDLASIVDCYWSLEVPASNNPEKQRILPDGQIEMAFILGDDIKRYTSEDGPFIIQPRAMILGQTTKPFYIEPTGHVYTFAIRFYPLGFTHFVAGGIKNLANKETPIASLFGQEKSLELEQEIIQATNVNGRIKIIEDFLVTELNNQSTIDNIIKSTVDTLLSTKGSVSVNTILADDLSKRRQLERNFAKNIGMSPKQLAKVIRFQASLKMLLNRDEKSLTGIAHECNYYDQAHFTKDFKEFTGVNPKDFLSNESLSLSSLFYK
jgi:AraC-like DNA-binding protein